jgi:Protein of unknown function (DUF3761)
MSFPNPIGDAMNTKAKTMIRSLALLAGLLAAQLTAAQAPAGAPSGATGLCKDGTYYTGASKQGACRGHQGVKDWYGAPAASGKAAPASGGTSTPAAAPAAPAAKSNPAPASTASSTPAPAQAAPATKSQASTMAQAPGGGAGQVWLNTASNVYHCPGTKYYGKTKTGTYMTEAEAKAKGGRPDHGQACK